MAKVFPVHLELSVARDDDIGLDLGRGLLKDLANGTFLEHGIGLVGRLEDQFDVLVDLGGFREDRIGIAVLIVFTGDILKVLGVTSDDLQRRLDVVSQRVDEVILELVVLVSFFVCAVRLDRSEQRDPDA